MSFLNSRTSLGREAQRDETLALGLHVRHAHRDMAVAVAMRIRLGAPLVPGEFEFGVRFIVAQIGEREVRKIQPMRDVEIESLLIEIERAFQIPHANHRVNEFRHERFLLVRQV